MATQSFNNYKIDLYNIIAPAIEKGVSGSKIADSLELLGMSRETALSLITVVGAWMNYEKHPELSPKEAYEMYIGL